MEKIIETIIVTTQQGTVQTFDMIVDPDRFAGRRAYVRGSTRYYEEAVFEQGLGSGKAAKIERHLAPDVDIFDVYGSK